MRQKLDAILAAVTAVTLVVGGLWLWDSSAHQAVEADNISRAFWAARFGSVAALAAAQVLGLGVIARAIFRRDRVSDLLRAAAALVCTAAMIVTLSLLWTVS